jgi:hypothetical protein
VRNTSTWPPTSPRQRPPARLDFVKQLTHVDPLVLEDFGMKKLATAAEHLLEILNTAGRWQLI